MAKTCALLAAAVAMLLTVLHASPRPQAPDFVAGCTIPFADIQGANAVGCTIAGNLGADPANQLQNRTKNNLCATGTPAEATWVTFKKLQANTDALPAPFTYANAGWQSGGVHSYIDHSSVYTLNNPEIAGLPNQQHAADDGWNHKSARLQPHVMRHPSF